MQPAGSVGALIERSEEIDPQLIDPQATEKLAIRSRVTFGHLLDALGDTLFSKRELGDLQNNPEVRQRLEESYLPTITALEWDRALSLTGNRSTSASGWWTVMVAGASGRFGLTVPQDVSRREVIALYVGEENNAKMLVYSPARRTLREVTDAPHCGPASRGNCLKGCGTCEATEVYDEATQITGIKCMCGHQTGQR